MEIDRIQSYGTAQLGNVSRDRRSRGNQAPAERSNAISVELSPAARHAGAKSAVTNANHESAASTAWFSSDEGQGALLDLRQQVRAARR
jgi:hypothetical protein